ncbi:MAG TPA: hypothetical protein DD979_08845 [Gammaproteobacteria bacterium]|nr:hypothetical protein [Gammaproteobacteria bacterium]
MAKHTTRNMPSDCVALKDTDLVYLACSTSFANAMGFNSPDDMIGKTDIELFDADIAMESLKTESDVVLHAKSATRPMRYGRVPHHVLVREPVLAADRVVSGIDMRIVPKAGAAAAASKREYYRDGMFHDQLAHRQSDVHVVRKPQGADYKNLLDSLPHGAMVCRGVKLVYVNRAAAMILGYKSPQALLRASVLTAVFRLEPWLDLSSGLRLPMARRQSELPPRIEIQGIRGDKQAVVLNAWAREVTWLNEKAVQLSFVDNTEQALAEQLLIESEQRFKHYAEASADFFWEMDADLNFTYLSQEFETALGMPISRLLGRNSQELMQKQEHANNDDQWAEQLDRLLHHQGFGDFEFKWVHPDGNIRVIRYSGVPVFSDTGQFTGYRGTGRDITGKHKLVESVAYQASHDSLTGLVNRRKFEECARDAIHSARNAQDTHALCFLDLDNFKVVNDSCGHLAGDELLRQLSVALQAKVRKSDVLARIGGDEFAVLLYNCGISEALRLADQLRSEVENFHFLWEGNRFSVGVSVGLVLVDKRWENIHALFRAADMACYLAKDAGRNRVVVYQDNDLPKSVRQGEMQWADQINAAINEQRVRIAYQKILPLKKNWRSYFEILMRLRNPDNTLVNPAAFLPAAERYGISTRLDETVVDATLAWLVQNPRVFDELGMCSINLSASSFANEVFAQSLLKKIQQSPLPAERFCFELSETSTIANLSSATKFVTLASELGCKVALDNFGSGLSSFAYMRNLPVHYVKIDGLYVRDVLDDATDHAMVKAINEIARTLGKKTVATFVENGRLLSRMRDLDVDYAQGFHIGEPHLIEHQ